MIPRLLVVDDDEYSREFFQELFRGKAAELFLAASGAEGMRLFADEDVNLVLMDQRLPDANGLDLVREMRRLRPRQVAILITGYADIRDAMTAVREGLYDYLTKPFEDLEELERVIGRALELDRAYREIDALRAVGEDSHGAPLMVGVSPQVRRLMTQIQQVARLDTTVLLEGESGTGKDCAARTLHAQSSRAGGRFVEVNCGAIPESLLESLLFGYERGAFTGALRATAGYFEKADSGTLFLDEIADMSAKLQAALLRVLQDGRFMRLGSTEPRASDFRLVCATNKPLAEEVRAGNFREDLYYRINVVALRLPPLRERKGDVLTLAMHFLEHFNGKFAKQVGPLSPSTLAILEAHPWPGNIRQLRHAVERLVALHPGGAVEAAQLEAIFDPAPAPCDAPPTTLPRYDEAREAFEKDYLLRLLHQAAGNVSEAARLSGIPRPNLYTRMKRWGVVTE